MIGRIVTTSPQSAGNEKTVAMPAPAGKNFPEKGPLRLVESGSRSAMMIDLQIAGRSAIVLALEPWRAKERGDMIGASLLLVLQLVAQSLTSGNPQILLEQLGATRYADREAAARVLEKLGREAIPVLRSARDSRDMEIRTRAAALLQKIEGSLLTMPTMVWLNFKDAPLADVVQALDRQTGMKVTLFPENLPRWKQERPQPSRGTAASVLEGRRSALCRGLATV